MLKFKKTELYSFTIQNVPIKFSVFLVCFFGSALFTIQNVPIKS